MGFDLFQHIKEHRPHFISQDGDCLIWHGTMQNNWPRICVKKTFYWPRSEMYIKHKGAFKRGRDVISLTCGNPRCINPEHMVLTTKAAPFLNLESISDDVPIKAKGTLAYLFRHKPEKIKRDGHCYLWLRCIQKGAPEAWINKKTVKLRPKIYEENYGAYDKKKFGIRTTCGENGCLNPSHMELVPQNQSLIDYANSAGKHDIRASLNRTLSSAQRKLTLENVAHIRNSDASNRSLADTFSVSLDAIRRIKRYQTFKVMPTAFGLMRVG